MFESFGNLKKEGNPFKDDLIPNNFSPDFKTIKQLEHNPDIVVREENYTYYDESPWRVSTEDKVEYHKQAQEKLKHLSSEYNIHIPPFNYVMGKNEKGEACMYTVTKKVDGIELDKALKNNEAQAETEELLVSLVSYLQDLCDRRGDYFWDIFSPRQYKYGTIGDEEEKQVYLVDFDPWQRTIPEGNDPETIRMMRNLLNNLKEHFKAFAMSDDYYPEIQKKLINLEKKINKIGKA